jgi:hypothetical protein
MKNSIDQAIAYSEHLTTVLRAIKKNGRKATRHQRETRRKIVVNAATRILASVLPKNVTRALFIEGRARAGAAQ